MKYALYPAFSQKLQVFLKVLLFCCLLAIGNTAFGQLLWSDEFNDGEQVDTGVWSYDLGAGGWGNSELQEYTSDPINLRVENGNLVISARSKDSGTARFTSGRINSEDKLTFKYGTIEARIKVPDLGDGLWPAFWTLGNDFSSVGWPSCGELDIMEMGHFTAIGDGVVNSRVGSAAHWENEGSRADYGLFFDAEEVLNDDFHVFRMEWTPELIETFVDDQLIWAIDIRPENCTDCSEFHQPHFIILNLAVGGGYPGIYSPAGITAPLPGDMLVDYVRIYDNGHTEMGGSGYVERTSTINAGITDAWYNPDTDGQGFFVIVWEELKLIFLGWFTYDVERPPEDVQAIIGEPGHRWLTAQGPYDGDTAMLDIYLTRGAIFDSEEPKVDEPRTQDGTVELKFADCETGTVTYEIPSAGLSGEIPIQRIVGSNVALCESLSGGGQEAVATD
jgi:beta-glucanase (GH16 family)